MPDLTHPEQIEFCHRHLRRNYVLHAVEGGMFIGAMGLVSFNTVLPKLIQSLGGPTWAISLMPVLMMAGMLAPPLLTAHYLEHLPRYMPTLRITGVFQRVPFLLTGLLLLLLPTNYRVLLVTAVIAAPLVSGLSGGITFTAWQQLVGRTVPRSRRASLFAMRFVVTSLIGVAAGRMVQATLQRFPGRTGYGLLHLQCFALLVLSYILFIRIREPVVPPEGERTPGGAMTNLRVTLPTLRAHPAFLRYLAVCVTMNGFYVLAPFMGLHALRVLDKPESFLGVLVTAQMLGGVVGNLAGGWLGDRRGPRTLMIVTQSVCALVAATSLGTESELDFRILFTVFGFGYFSQHAGANTMVLELLPETRRSTCLAVAAFARLVGLLLAATLASVLMPSPGFSALALTTLIAAAITIVLLATIPDPRAVPTQPDQPA